MPGALVNGTELFYLTIGSGPPCLVMHGGLGFDHTYLHTWLDSLGNSLRLIYYDHRGNGRSSGDGAETLTLEQLADDADALRGMLGVRQIDIMAHSVGGLVALTYALRYGEKRKRTRYFSSRLECDATH